MRRHVNAQTLHIFRLNFAGGVRHDAVGVKYPDLTDLLMLQKNIHLSSCRHPLRQSRKNPLIVLLKLKGDVHVTEFYEKSKCQTKGGGQNNSM